MKLHANKFAIACAGAFAIIWVICSILVMISPMGMMGMSGHMVHSDFSGMSWSMGLVGLFIGLIAWSLSAGATGWLIATLYNRQID